MKKGGGAVKTEGGGGGCPACPDDAPLRLVVFGINYVKALVAISLLRL